MSAYLLDWLSLLLRWGHVVAAMAWIGLAFYFIWLDRRLETPRDDGFWAMEAGAVYRTTKHGSAAELPPTLHNFRWEAYSTWLTGFALLVVLYYANAELYLIDPQVMALSKAMAIGISLGVLVVGLAIYEGLCRTAMSETVLAIVLFGLLVATAWALTLVFSGRGAFIHYGALLGTIMAGNVAHVTIPAQRRIAQALREGREGDPKDVARARQRALHNSYLALPVVFAMISNHYAVTFGHRWAWVVLVALTLAGVLIRGGLVVHRAWLWIAGVAAIAAAAWLAAPARVQDKASVSDEQITTIIEHRCVRCHAQHPSFPGHAQAPKGVMLDTPERVRAQAAQIRQQAVLTRAMPPGNITKMTDGERELLARWLGARRVH